MSNKFKIPLSLEHQLYELSRKKCCICFVLESDKLQKEGRIAYLDDESSTPKIQNIVWLCSDHYEEYFESKDINEQFSTSNVKGYRNELYNYNKDTATDKSSSATSKKRKTIFFFILVIICVSIVSLLKFWPENYSKEKSIISIPKLFSEKDSTYNVVLIPFQKYASDQNLDVAKIVEKRLNVENYQNHLNLNIKYLNYNATPSFTPDSAEILRSYHSADLLVFGDYIANDSGNLSPHEISFNYSTELGGNYDLDFQKSTLLELAKGKLQGNIDFIVYYTLIKSLLDSRNWSQAIKYGILLKKKDNFNSDPFSLWLVNQCLIIAYTEMGYQDLAQQLCVQNLKLSPAWKDPNIVMMTFIQSGQIAIENGNLKIGLLNYENAIQVWDSNSQNFSLDTNSYSSLLYMYSETLLQLGDLTKSSKIVNRISKLNPKDTFKVDYIKAKINHKLGKYSESKIHLKHGLKFLKHQNNPQNDKWIGVFYMGYAKVQVQLNNLDSAQIYYRLAFTNFMQVYKDDEINLARFLMDYARFLFKTKKFKSATVIMQLGTNVMERNPGITDSERAIFYDTQTKFYYVVHDTTNFEFYGDKAVELMEKIYTKDDPNLIELKKVLYKVHHKR